MIWDDVETLRQTQDATNREAVRLALAAGAKPLRCYRQEGRLILLVERTTRQPGEPDWPLWCAVPEDKEQATLAWVQAHAAREEVRLSKESRTVQAAQLVRSP